MLDAISAEALKFGRHRATWFLVWIYPIGFVILAVLGIMIGLTRTNGLSAAPDVSKWIEGTAAIWYVPPHVLGRYFISAFTAVVFAGEYGWNTWKLVVPHRARGSLIAAKFAITFLLLYAAFVATGLLAILLTFVSNLLIGDPIPSGITAAALAEAQWLGAIKALPAVLLTVAYTALAAVLTRSMIAALVIGLVITTAEQTFLGLAPMLAYYAPGLVSIVYQLLAGYHFENLASWIGGGAAYEVRLPESGPIAMSWATSLVALAAWTCGLAGLTWISFKRQDIN
jgi:ABC-type transport system involved in multi-copper enzyme maturation permease subunit